jgi:accessory gene regulator B
MYLIEKISNKIGNKIALNLNLDKDNEEIIIYGAFNLLQTLWAILCVVILGIIFKVLVQALIVAFTAAILRKYSGGAHASSPNKCAGIGAVIVVGFALVIDKVFMLFNIKIIVSLVMLGLVISYYIINKLAPVDSPAKPIVKLETKKRLKKQSILTLSSFIMIMLILGFIYFKYKINFFLSAIECIYIGAMWQTFTLTAKGHQLLHKIEDVLNML